MSAPDAFGAVRTLARELPFDFSDVEAAGRTFAECRVRNVALACRLAQVWAYIYVLRYFTTRFTFDTQRDPVDCDRLVADCFERILGGMDGLEHDDRFPAWVSVVCKNTFRSYLRTRAVYTLALPDDEALSGDDPPDDLDPTFTHLAVSRAIGKLPDYLRDLARRRLLENASYEDLAAESGHPVEVVRTYVNKAMVRLRQDAGVRMAAGRA
jgi:RNA polymerase sigma factor (sigma-70 family)